MKNKTSSHAPGPFPLTANCNDGKYTIITNQCNHLATTYDPSAARLIVAAPELLAAAKNARNVLAALAVGDLKEVKANSPALAELRVAIAKAEGNQDI